MEQPISHRDDSVKSPRAEVPRLSKTIVNFWLDVLLLVVFVVLATVSSIVQFVFPPGVAASGWSLWGGDYIAWRQVQFGVLCTLAAAILLHVMLHWNWVCSVLVVRVLGRRAKSNSALQTLYGVAFLIALLHVMAGVYLAALLTITAPDDTLRFAVRTPRPLAIERPQP